VTARTILLAGGDVVHPDGVRREDVLVVDGAIAEVADRIGAPAGAEVLDAQGCVVGPGLVDLHTHLREPGREEAETIESAAFAGALGGYTALVAMPNTEPACDSAAVVADVLSRARGALCDVAPAGAITKGREGTSLAPMAEMARMGVTLFTDDGAGVQDGTLMRRALEYARGLDVTLAQHCEDANLAAGGVMHEGAWSSRLGLAGQPAIAETAMVARDLGLVELTHARLHFLHLSVPASVRLVDEARRAGLPVTCEVAPHHLTLDDGSCAHYDPTYKVNPPLRPRSLVDELCAQLRAGMIDAIATDHAPHPPESKERTFDEASPGMLGLQHALSLSVAALGGAAQVDPVGLFDLLSRRPAAIARLRAADARPGGQGAHGGALVAGECANLCVVDLAATRTATLGDLASRSRNSPYLGRDLPAAVRHTIHAGDVTVRDGVLER